MALKLVTYFVSYPEKTLPPIAGDSAPFAIQDKFPSQAYSESKRRNVK